MDIEEIRNLKIVCENNICACLEMFEQKSGLVVDKINIGSKDFNQYKKDKNGKFVAVKYIKIDARV
jgi:hypothetical protein